MSTTFSIIITCYNHRNYFESLHKMLMAQTFRDFEVIIVDNNSKDGSKELLQDFYLKGIKIQKVFNNSNLGICKAFNKGAKLSTGKYLIDLSPDDVFTIDKLERNFTLLENNNSELLFSDCSINNEKGEVLGVYSKLYPFEYREKGNYFCHVLERHRLSSPTMVFSKKLYDALEGYDESLAYEDFDFISRATKATDLVYDQKVLVNKYQAPKSLSTQFKSRKRDIHNSTLRVCEKLRDLCSTESEIEALKSRLRLERKIHIKLYQLDLVIAYTKLLRSL